jgi:translation initiation factor 2-alpha kinase 3
VYAVKKVVIPASDLEKQMQMSSHALDNKLGEVRSLAKLRHDNVVCYHHCWIEFRKAVAGHNVHSSAGISFSGCSNDAPSAKDTTSGPSTSNSTSTSEDITSLVPGFENMQIDLGRRDLDFELADGALGHQNEDDDFIVFGNSATSNTEESHHESKKAIQKYQHAKVDFDAVLFVKMTAYPLSLEDYIGLKGKTVEFPYRNCFHTLPAVRILLAIIDGLQYVHRKGIIHQDMKPGNIFLSILEDGEPAKPSHVNIFDCSDCAYPPATSPIHVSPHIGDFGLIHDLRGEVSTGAATEEDEIPGTLHGSEAAGGPSRLRVMPEDASGKGTAFYRPPRIPGVEMILCPKRDCYALGVIALEMVYKFGSASERIHILTDLRQNGIVPKEIKDHKLGECIMGMLQRNREERWGLNRAKEFLVDMENRLRR